MFNFKTPTETLHIALIAVSAQLLKKPTRVSNSLSLLFLAIT